MNALVKAIAEECTEASDTATMAFPQIVMMLNEAGFERYRADLCRSEKTYYLPNGETIVTPCAPLTNAIATAFSPSGVEAAVRASQAGAITYTQFCERIADAGCVDYIVSLAGRRAVYFGRTGESHVELFPGGK